MARFPRRCCVWCSLIPGGLCTRLEPMAQPLQLTLQTHDLVFECQATPALPLELLNRLAQRVDFVRPSILVRYLARLGTLGSFKHLVPRHFSSCPALLGLRESLAKFCHRCRLIGPRFSQRATQGE